MTSIAIASVRYNRGLVTRGNSLWPAWDSVGLEEGTHACGHLGSINADAMMGVYKAAVCLVLQMPFSVRHIGDLIFH